MALSEDELGPNERDLIAQARKKAEILYEGKITPHRSCGVCLAETFGLEWRPYQALRRGGVTGEGVCGAIRAGEMILGDLLGPDRPEGDTTEAMKAAILFYQKRWKEIQGESGWGDTICNTLTSPFADFQSTERKDFCTNMAVVAAELVAETLVRVDYSFEIEPFKAERSA